MLLIKLVASICYINHDQLAICSYIATYMFHMCSYNYCQMLKILNCLQHCMQSITNLIADWNYCTNPYTIIATTNSQLYIKITQLAIYIKTFMHLQIKISDQPILQLQIQLASYYRYSYMLTGNNKLAIASSSYTPKFAIVSIDCAHDLYQKHNLLLISQLLALYKASQLMCNCYTGIE